MTTASPAKKKRRIAPTPVAEEDAPAALLADAAPEASPAAQLAAPEPGRRIWVDLAAGYDVNYRRLVAAQVGAKAAAQPSAPALAPDARGTLGDVNSSPSSQLLRASGGQASTAGSLAENHVQRALERIQRRIQREQNAAATGVQDSDEEDDPAEAVAPGATAGAGAGEGAEPEVEGAEGDDDKEDEQEEPEEQGQGVAKGPQNRYDVFDDFIDDSEFISAVENRDERKTKHQGFFVNSGGVERIGDKAAPPRKGRKPKAKPATGAAAGSNVGGADRGKAAAAAAAPLLAGSGQAAVAPAAAANRQNSALAPASFGGSAPAWHVASAREGPIMQMHLAGARDGTAAAGKHAAAAHASASVPPSAQRMSLQARNGSPAGAARLDAASGRPLDAARPSVARASSSIAASHATGGSGGTREAPVAGDDGNSRPPQAAPSISLDDHAAAMRAIRIQLPPEHQATLSNWSIPAHLASMLEDLRNVAALTPPNNSTVKRKTPTELSSRLEALTRPFYVACERSGNVNRAKKALWSIVLPLLTPWITENTVKTKMQQLNSRIVGQYALEREMFEAKAAYVGSEQERLNEPEVIDAIKSFMPRLAQYEGVCLDDTVADTAVWEKACSLWESAGGCPLTPDILRSFYHRASA